MSNPLLLESLVRTALLEDLGRAGDITTEAIVEPGRQAVAEIRAREAGITAGSDAARLAFALLDPQCEISLWNHDGSPFEAESLLMRISGKARALLSAERTALNFLGRLCGIATLTAAYVREVAGTKAAILCTRKTTPGLRFLEKEAVRLGGGKNHRFGLDDAALIKENHIAAAGSLRAAVERLRAQVGRLVKIEIEVETLDQLEEALSLGLDTILLDNMSLAEMREAVEITAGRAWLEASGSMRLDRVREVAETGIDAISVGRLTHSVKNLDLGLDFL
jgi:nicotinate-nucleotide pyrophosphorylase (carboxylating)